MKLAFDAKRAFLNNSGLGNYSRSLIQSLLHYYPDNELNLYTPKIKPSSFAESLKQAKQVSIISPSGFLANQFPAVWRSFAITDTLVKNKCDVYHGLSNELPLNISKFKGKKIVSIHDLIFLRYPELYPLMDRNMYDRKSEKSCKKADLVIAISEQTKKDIIEFYHIPESKIKVVYQSCDDVYYHVPSVENMLAARQKFKLPDEYILSVGTVEARKDLLTLLKSLTQIQQAKLVVVGRKTAYYKQCEEYIVKEGLSGRISFLDNVSNAELACIYRMAKLFIFPSLFEGFGIPILEALNCQVPVIAALNSSLTEVGGKDSLYFQTGNSKQLAELIRNVLNSETLSLKMIEKGTEQALKFRPAQIAMNLMEIYRS